MTDDDRKILLRKRCEQSWLQRYRGDPNTVEALDALVWAYFKGGVINLAELRQFRLSSGFYNRKFKHKSKVLA
jgi:hypothetical protein